MIPDFKTFIKESIWSDMQDRSTGETVREEDKFVNQMDYDEFFKYIYTIYLPLGNHNDYSIDRFITRDQLDIVVIQMPLENIGIAKQPYILTIKINKDLDKIVLIRISSRLMQRYPDISKHLGDKYIISDTYTIKPVSGKITNYMCLDVIDKLLSMVKNPLFKRVNYEKLSESIWSDMQDRSTGEIVRKEDSVDLLDINELCEYLKTIYKTDSDNDINVIKIEGNLYLLICLYEDEYGYYKYIYYDGDYISMQFDVIETLKCFSEFERKFSIRFTKSDFVVNRIEIYPKDKTRIPVTNKFFIEVLDFILDRINTPLEQKIKKISNIKESIWSDIQDRSMGKTVRKEDDINLLDIDEFFVYLTEHYQPKNKKINEKIGGRTSRTNTNIIEIFIPIEYIDNKIGRLTIEMSKKDNSVVSMAASSIFFDKYTNLRRMWDNYSGIHLKPMEKPTNKTVVDLIDMFLNVVERPILIKKKI